MNFLKHGPKGIFLDQYGCMFVVAALCCVFAAAPAAALDDSESLVSAEFLRSKIDEISATDTLNEEIAKKLLERYRKALNNLEQLRSHRATAAAYEQAKKNAPAAAEKLRKSLDKAAESEVTPTIRNPGATRAAAEQALNKERADLAAVESKRADLQQRYELEIDRPNLTRQRLLESRRELDAIAEELAVAAAAPGDDPDGLAEASRWVLEIRAAALRAETIMLDQELLSHRARVGLIELQLEEAQWSVDYVRARVVLLDEILNQRRREEAEQAQEEVEALQALLENKHPVVRQLAQRNLDLSKELGLLAASLEALSTNDDDVRARATRVRDELQRTQKKISSTGLGGVIGRVLVEQRRQLPELATMREEARARAREITDAALRQAELLGERRALRSSETYVNELTASLPAEEAAEVNEELRGLARKRRDLVQKAIESSGAYVRGLGDLDLAQQQLIDAVEAYDEFLEARLLWIRSAPPASFATFRSVPSDLALLLSPTQWAQTGRDLFAALRDVPSGMLLLFLLGLAMMRPRLLRLIDGSATKIRTIRSDRYTYTVEALTFTLLAAAPLPLLVLAIGRIMKQSATVAPFSDAVATGLITITVYYFVFRLFADICRDSGLAIKHFRWPADSVRKLRVELRWFAVAIVAVAFVISVDISLLTLGAGDGLVLCSMTVGLAATALFAFRIYTPDGGVLREFLLTNPKLLRTRLRPVWLSLFVAIPLGLIVLALAGYISTARTLGRDLILTHALIFGIAVLQGLVVRWLLLVERRLALKQLLERRDEARAAREAAAAGEPEPSRDDDMLDIEEPEVDLDALNTQSRRLVDTTMAFVAIVGLGLIWSFLLPAFGVLEDVSLWTRTVVIDGQEQIVAVTLADMVLAAIAVIITVAMAKGLPAFLEFVLLQRIAITAGARYTASTLLRYTVVGIGAVVVFSLLGGSWSQIQWLVAALGVGIGFGLQEIVANFISGLIILIERPIRVGDTVTVGDVTGVISRIKIRATTVVNWDRQELLVPNKEFITTRLLNWTLSDPIIRVRIPVGVTYGSDIGKAMILMKEAADEHPNVLEDPAPSVTFEQFGDNSLNLFLRAFIGSMDHRIWTISALHEAINEKFNAAGIVIAFPQRDVHIDQLGPLDVRVHPAED